MTHESPPAPRPMTLGGAVMVAVGALLFLFPGGCGLFGLLSVLVEMSSRRSGGGLDLTGLVLGFSLLGLGLAVLGAFLIRWGWRRRKDPAAG